MTLWSTSGNFSRKRCSGKGAPQLSQQYRAEPSLPPSLSFPATASRAIPAGRERARGDPSSCEAAPARKAARPRCHKRGISCPQSPAAGFRRSSSTRHSYSWGIRGRARISKRRLNVTSSAQPVLPHLFCLEKHSSSSFLGVFFPLTRYSQQGVGACCCHLPP